MKFRLPIKIYGDVDILPKVHYCQYNISDVRKVIDSEGLLEYCQKQSILN